MSYIGMNDHQPKGATGCIFCDKSAQQLDRENLIIYRGNTAFVLMNLYPYNNGHLMVAPYLHTSSLSELSDEALIEIAKLTRCAVESLKIAYSPQGFNTGMNLGSVAGAGIADHLHQHIVPRWNGDANFMPVIGETKVLPESLEQSYDRIVKAWESVNVPLDH